MFIMKILFAVFVFFLVFNVYTYNIKMFTFFATGGTPYPNISPNEVVEFLAAEKRMDRPHLCPEEM